MVINQQVRNEVISHVIGVTTRCSHTHWTHLTNQSQQQVRNEVISHVIGVTARCSHTHWTHLNNIVNRPGQKHLSLKLSKHTNHNNIPCWYLTKPLRQLSLVIHPWVGIMSTSDGYSYC